MPQLPPELQAMLGGAGGAGGAGGPPSSGNPFGVSPEMLKEMGGMKGLQQQAAAMWKHMDELAAKDPQEYSVRASPVAACSTIDSYLHTHSDLETRAG